MQLNRGLSMGRLVCFDHNLGKGAFVSYAAARNKAERKPHPSVVATPAFDAAPTGKGLPPPERKLRWLRPPATIFTGVDRKS